MYFYAGFQGVGQDKKTLSLKLVIGWAVAEDEQANFEQKTIKIIVGILTKLLI